MSTPVATTSAGSNDNNWTKIATIDFGSTNYQDFSLILAFAAAEGHPQTAIVEFAGRQNISPSTSDLYASILSLGGGQTFSEQSFIIANAGTGSNFEIWISKTKTYGQINVFELASDLTGSYTVTYLSNQGWVSAPTSTPVTKSYINGEYLNVKDYGAKGDGSTQDDAAIGTALAAGSAVSRNVFFPPGTYIVNTQITIPSNTGIIGAGQNSTIIKLADGCPVSVPPTQGNYPFILNAAGSSEYITLRNFTFDGNRANNPGNEYNGLGGFYADQSSNLTIQHMSFINTRTCAINAKNIPNAILSFITVSNCALYKDCQAPAEYVVGTDRQGIILLNEKPVGDAYYCGSDVAVDNIYITGTGADGLNASIGTTYYKVINNYCGAQMMHLDTGGAGIYYRASATGFVGQATFMACEAHHNTGIGIDIGNVNGGTDPSLYNNINITGCLASYNNLNGIGLDGCSGGTIRGCTSWNNGIQVDWWSGGTNYRRCGIGIGTSPGIASGGFLVEQNRCFDNQMCPTQQGGLYYGNYEINVSTPDNPLGTLFNIMVRENDFTGNVGTALISILPGALFITSGYLSIQNNAGLFSLDITSADDLVLNPAAPTLNLTATSPISINGITTGIINDRITLHNTSTHGSDITLVNSSSFVMPGGTNFTLHPGDYAVFDCFNDGTVWIMVLHQP